MAATLQYHHVQFSQGLFYNGGEVQLVQQDTIGFLGGSTLCLWNLASHTKDYIMSNRRGFQCFTTSHKQSLIAVAEYGKQPTIILYKNIKQNHMRIEGLATLEISKLSLSPDGKHLLVVCGIPDNCIKIYNIQKNVQLHMEQPTKVKSGDGVKLLQVAFNPSNNNQFFALYSYELITYSIETSYDTTNPDAVNEINRIVQTHTFKSEDQELKYALWDELNNIYMADDSAIHYIDGGQMLTIQSHHTDPGLVCLVLTQRHVIAFHKDGTIEWLNKYYKELKEVLKDEQNLQPFVLDHRYKIDSGVQQAFYNHTMTRIIVTKEDAQIISMKIEAEKNVLNEEEEEKGEAEGKINQRKNVNLPALQTQSFGPHHTSSISFLRELSSSPTICSADRSGLVIFWSLANKNVVGSLHTSQQITCGDINKQQNVLAVGTSRGTVLLYEISDNFKLHLIYEYKLYDKEVVSQVQFNAASQLLAVSSVGSKQIFFVMTNINSRFQVVGYCTLPFEVFNTVWNTSSKTGRQPQLFVLVGFAILGIVPPEAKNHNRRGEQLKLELDITARKTDPDMLYIAVLASGDIVVTGKDKILKKYKQPEEVLSKVDFKVRAANTPPIEQLDGHDLITSCFSLSHKNNELVSGGVDGTVIVRNADVLNQVRCKIQTQSLESKGVSAVVASNVGHRFFSAGHDGSIFVWSFQKMNLTTGYVRGSPLPKGVHKQISSQGQDLATYHQIIEHEYMESIKDQVLEKKKQQLNKINRLKSELSKLVKQNEKDEELERLDRDEFAIDIEAREAILKEGAIHCQQMRKMSLKNNLKKEIMANRIKQRTWDRMEVQLRAINGLKQNFLVYNYQIRKRSPEEERTVQIILEIRRQNLREQKQRKQTNTKETIDMDLYKNRFIVNGGTPAVLVYGDYDKVEDKKDDKTKKKKEEEDKKDDKPTHELQYQTDEQWTLLYNALQLFSSNSKRNQIIMIKNIIFKIKQAFNKEFDKVLHFRQQQTETINQKNKRITEIFEDLKRVPEVVGSKKNILENPEKILKVDPNEVGFKKYLSREERERLEKERLKEEERLRLLAQDDAGQRALGKMMGGTLEQKKQSVLEVVIEREKWMDKAPDDMTEDQKMRMKEYEVKKQKAEEEKERTIKKLESEYRKLRQQIDEIIDKFDQKLFSLFRRKLEYDYRIEEQELYAAKLAVSMITVNDAEKKKKLLEIDKESKQLAKNRLTTAINQVKAFSAELTKLKEQKRAGLEVKRGGELEGRIKNVEKNVFDELHNNEKKRKEIEKKWMDRDPNLKNVLIELDPFLQLEQRSLFNMKNREFSTYIEQIRQNQQGYEGNQQPLMHALENRFNLKRQQAELEKRIKAINDFTNELEAKLNQLRQDQTEIINQITEYNSFLESSKSNIEVQFRMKQGFIEIAQDKPIPNLSKALLIPRAAIEDRNNKILESADQKIKVMQNIKICKISVTQETLNLQKKQSMAAQLQQKIKEVQMLKVKKEMQTALAKKDVKMNETELKNLTEQIENLKREADKRILVFQSKMDKINADMDFIRRENSQLEVQKWNLETTVKQRQKIQQMNGDAAAQSRESSEKFEKISTNRKLFDKAKKQTEEIELLREELSKLKLKTFANFSNIQR